MYSTCLYCNKDLGANEVLEPLPIGRRVAFDAAQGRLWVVCRSCEKWNLVPFDTRLETIDMCERLFGETRVRFSTDNIGIARLKEGLELVRIGPAQRPEFAAWRYGDQFGRRRRKHALVVAGIAAVTGAVMLGGHELFVVLRAAGISGGMGWQAIIQGNNLYQRRRAVVHIPVRDGVGGAMTTKQVREATIQRFGRQSWSLYVPMYRTSHAGIATGWKDRGVKLYGLHAIEALGKIMPRLNAKGGSQKAVREAVDLMEERPPLDNPLPGLLTKMDQTVRLALEMAAHEDTERTALAGELKLLERQWQEAEAVAKIADSLAVSDDVDREVNERRSP